MSRIDTQFQKKIGMLGDFSVGKTSLVERLVYNRFDAGYLSTIGAKISRKSVDLEGNILTHRLLWNLAGGEEFSSTQASYLQRAAGTLIVCDLTRKETLAAVENYAGQLRAIQPKAGIIVVANKSDLSEQRQIRGTDLQNPTANLDAPPFITSAMTGEQGEDAFFRLASTGVG